MEKKNLLPLPQLEPRSLQPGSLIAIRPALNSYIQTHLDKCSIITLRLYEEQLESKERFAIKNIFIDNRKETKYAGFITHLHLLLHIVTLDIEALVVL